MAAEQIIPKKVIYMHMAKTAGSSINSHFEGIFGSDKCCRHIERFDNSERAERVKNNRYVSGHLYMSDIDRLVTDRNNTYIFTILRDPIKQIASHIQWLDHYNMPAYKNEYQRLSSDVRGLIDEVGKVDYDSVEQLDTFITNLSPIGIRLLDNMQTRYFCSEPAPKPLTLAHAATARQIAKKFDRIGFLENVIPCINLIRSDIGLDTKIKELASENKALSERKLNIDRPIVRQILLKRSLADIRLYNYLKADFLQE